MPELVTCPFTQQHIEAHAALSNDAWFAEHEAARLQRLKPLGGVECASQMGWKRC